MRKNYDISSIYLLYIHFLNEPDHGAFAFIFLGGGGGAMGTAGID